MIEASRVPNRIMLMEFVCEQHLAQPWLSRDLQAMHVLDNEGGVPCVPRDRYFAKSFLSLA